MSKDLTGHDLFWLARRAYNAFRPLVERYRATSTAKAKINFYIDLRMLEDYGHSVSVQVFNYGPNEFLTNDLASTAEEIDALAAEFEQKVIQREIDQMNRDIVAGLVTKGVAL